MSPPAPPTLDSLDSLLDHLQATTGLGRSEARRVVEEVLAWHDEDLAAFVRRRHRELTGSGSANPQAFARIVEELRTRRVAAPRLSARQVRRLIYG